MRKKLFIVIIVIAALVMIAAEVFKPQILADENLNSLLIECVTRLFGAVLFFVVILFWKLNILKFDSVTFRKYLLIIPCILVAVNNLPTVSLITHRSYIAFEAPLSLLFIVKCITVAMFEEFAFRGIVQTVILEKHHKNFKSVVLSIVVSSAVFGAVHLLNLFYGAGIGPTLLQVGYSFLIGCLCSYVLIQTSNIWMCVICHAVYNFTGQIVPTLGGGEMLNTAQIIITSIIGIGCLLHIVFTLKKTKPEDIDIIYT